MTNYYTTPDVVRKELGLKIDDVPDEDLNYYIEKAQKDMLRDVAYYVENEEPDEDADGINKTFTVDGKYIADKNFNSKVDSLDVTVYGWTDDEDPATKVSLTVSTIYPADGKIVLATAPASTYAKITCDYYYYGDTVTFDQFSDACACLAAYYYARAEWALVPEQWMHGAYRFKVGEQYEKLLKEYQARVTAINGRISMRGTHDTITFMRGEGET